MATNIKRLDVTLFIERCISFRALLCVSEKGKQESRVGASERKTSPRQYVLFMHLELLALKCVTLSLILRADLVKNSSKQIVKR